MRQATPTHGHSDLVAELDQMQDLHIEPDRVDAFEVVLGSTAIGGYGDPDSQNNPPASPSVFSEP